MNAKYGHIEIGSVIRAWEFDPALSGQHKYFVEGVVDAFYTYKNNRYMCVEITTDTVLDRDFIMVPTEIEHEWDNRVELLGYDERYWDD